MKIIKIENWKEKRKRKNSQTYYTPSQSLMFETLLGKMFYFVSFFTEL